MKDWRTHLTLKSSLMFPGDEKVSKYAPILFEGHKKDMKKMFKCEYLALVRVWPHCYHNENSDRYLDALVNSIRPQFFEY